MMHIEDGTFQLCNVYLKEQQRKSGSMQPIIHLHMRIQLQEKDILSTHICVMGIHFQVLKENQSLVAIRMKISMTFTDTLMEQLK